MQTMVFFQDEGSEFDAPLDKMWKLNQSEHHSHPSLKNPSTSTEGEHPILSYETQMPDGGWVKEQSEDDAVPADRHSLRDARGTNRRLSLLPVLHVKGSENRH